MKPVLSLPFLLAGVMMLGGAIGDTIVASVPSAGEPEVFDVAMMERGPMEMRFEPADLVVRSGDVVRFVQRGVQPHNVEFTGAPAGAEIGDLGDLRMGPFLIQRGQVYEIVIDERFVPGEYDFVCTPHVPMGMKGTLTVLGDENERDG